MSRSKLTSRVVALVLTVLSISAARADVVVSLKGAHLRDLSALSEGERSEVVQASLSFRGFVDCRAQFDPGFKKPKAALRGCTEQFLDPTLSAMHKNRYERWLFTDYKVSEPYVCAADDEKLVRATREIGPERLVLCFKIARERQGSGYLVFARGANGALGLNEIIFSNAGLH